MNRQNSMFKLLSFSTLTMCMILTAIWTQAHAEETCTIQRAPETRAVSLSRGYTAPSSYWGYPGGGPFHYADHYDYVANAVADALSVYHPPFNFYREPFTGGSVYLELGVGSLSFQRFRATNDPVPDGFTRGEKTDGVAIDLRCPGSYTLESLSNDEEPLYGDHRYYCETPAIRCHNPGKQPAC